MSPIEIIERAIDRTVARVEYTLGKSVSAGDRALIITEMTASLAMVLALEAERAE